MFCLNKKVYQKLKIQISRFNQKNKKNIYKLLKNNFRLKIKNLIKIKLNYKKKLIQKNKRMKV